MKTCQNKGWFGKGEENPKWKGKTVSRRGLHKFWNCDSASEFIDDLEKKWEKRLKE